jgi:hypothetical protein
VAWSAEAVAETAPFGGAVCAVHLGHPTEGHALEKIGKGTILRSSDIATVAVATPCLRRFAVTRPGRVLLYPAEDALHIDRRRRHAVRTRHPGDHRAQPAP